MSTANRASLSFGGRVNLWLLGAARHWQKIALGFLAIYISLPVVAPTLMHLGLEAPARVIYGLYSPMCHRFAFRSLFLYGEQPAYPLASTGTDLKPFEEYAQQSPIPVAMRANRVPQPPFNVAGMQIFTGITIADDVTPQSPSEAVNFARFQLASASFLGNAQMGYKMTICARDISIYVAMFVALALYQIPVVQRKLRPCPLWLFFLLGVAPIGIDGFSQMLGYPPFSLWEARETLPIFRILTGATFGFMTAWLGFPYLNEAMQDTQRAIEAKFARKGIRV